jgi:hypothetical protein
MLNFFLGGSNLIFGENSKVGEILGGVLSEDCFSSEDAENLVEAMWISNLLVAFAKDTLSLSQLAHSSLLLVCPLSDMLRTLFDSQNGR